MARSDPACCRVGRCEYSHAAATRLQKAQLAAVERVFQRLLVCRLARKLTGCSLATAPSKAKQEGGWKGHNAEYLVLSDVANRGARGERIGSDSGSSLAKPRTLRQARQGRNQRRAPCCPSYLCALCNLGESSIAFRSWDAY